MILILFLTHGAQSVSHKEHKAGKTTSIVKKFHLSSQVKASFFLAAES
jgi:hypothetical protein